MRRNKRQSVNQASPVEPRRGVVGGRCLCDKHLFSRPRLVLTHPSQMHRSITSSPVDLPAPAPDLLRLGGQKPHFFAPKGVLRCAVPNMLPQCTHYLSWRHLKNSKYQERLSLNSSYLPKDRYMKRSSMVISPLPGRFTNQGNGP